jgi:methylated-DNA-[protein]-cysteine S-methyltransferase
MNNEEPTMSTATTASTRHIVTESPIGPLTLVREDDGLTGLYFRGHWTRPDRSAFGPRVGQSGDHGFDEAITQLAEYLAGRRREFGLPLFPHGSAEAQAVWRLIAEIPYGGTATYGTLASRLGSQATPRDVGWYVAHNPLSILIPCHRLSPDAADGRDLDLAAAVAALPDRQRQAVAYQLPGRPALCPDRRPARHHRGGRAPCRGRRDRPAAPYLPTDDDIRTQGVSFT